MQAAIEAAQAQNIPVDVGNVITSDVFYNANPNYNDAWRRMGVLCAEMEVAALYLNAAQAHKQALAMMTVSDHIYKDTHLSADERRSTFGQMIGVALETAIKL